ncbi:MAG TPA: hypothetical protein VEG30_17370 [Terriglobales bacterium]|nr:hypothetical protein [Terriglobales bacterium]
MGRVIEFYIPDSFQPKWQRSAESKEQPGEERGKLIEFPSAENQKSA